MNRWFAMLFVAGCLNAQPLLYPYGNPRNAASFYLDETRASQEIARGSIFVASGTDLGPDDPQSGSAGTTVTFTVGRATRNALVLYSSSRLVAAIVPHGLPIGQGSITVAYQGRQSNPIALQVVERAFGLFSLDGNGVGEAFAHNLDADGEFRLNGLTHSARPGQTVVLWGTGLGSTPKADLEVSVGGRLVAALDSGPSDNPGVEWLAFQVPAGAEGCHVPVAVHFRDADWSRNFLSISIASDGGTCSDRHGLLAADIDRIESGQPVRRALINVGSYWAQTRFFADFRTVSSILDPYTLTAPPPLGTCQVTRDSSYGARFRLPGMRTPLPVAYSPLPYLDAGRFLNVQGPQIAKRVFFPYFENQLPALGGAWTVTNDSSGRDVGTFNTTLLVPSQPFRWTNAGEMRAASSAQELEITWAGGAPTGEYVLIEGSISDDNTSFPSRFTCAENATVGSFRVPAYVLQAIRRGSLGQTLTLTVSGKSYPMRFAARGLDRAEFSYAVVETRFYKW